MELGSTTGVLEVQGYGLTDSGPDFPKLEESARNGCTFCSFLRTVLLSPEVEYDVDEFPRIQGAYRPPQESPSQLIFQRAQFFMIPYDFDEKKFWLQFEIWIIHGKALTLL
jgi:hypothetical protein